MNARQEEKLDRLIYIADKIYDLLLNSRNMTPEETTQYKKFLKSQFYNKPRDS